VLYLRWSAPGMPAMLVVLAATGVLRACSTPGPAGGRRAGAALNVALNVVLVHGLHLGHRRLGAGTASTQLLMALAVGAVVVRGPGGPAHRCGPTCRESTPRRVRARPCSCAPSPCARPCW
jgi:Na+-driven multidrug efflux pump